MTTLLPTTGIDTQHAYRTGVGGETFIYPAANRPPVEALQRLLRTCEPTRTSILNGLVSAGLPTEWCFRPRTRAGAFGDAVRSAYIGMDCPAVAHDQLKLKANHPIHGTPDQAFLLGHRGAVAHDRSNRYYSESEGIARRYGETIRIELFVNDTDADSRASAVESEFYRLYWVDERQPSFINKWAQSIMTGQLDAVRAAYNETHEPMGNEESARASLVAGVTAEVDAIESRLQSQARQADKRGTVVGVKAVNSAITDLESIASKSRLYSELASAPALVALADRVRAIIAEYSTLHSTTEIRGALIWDEIRNEAPTVAPAPVEVAAVVEPTGERTTEPNAIADANAALVEAINEAEKEAKRDYTLPTESPPPMDYDGMDKRFSLLELD